MADGATGGAYAAVIYSANSCRPPWRHSRGRCIICGIPINVCSPIVTEPHYYGNVCSMYYIVAVMQYT